MKKLRADIKKILKNECLTIEEKIKLKNIFKKFIIRREILSRKSIDFEYHDNQCFGLENVYEQI